MTKTHLTKVKQSIKLRDVEEVFDIYFSRFFGLFFAYAGKKLGLTPTHVSLISLAIGVPAGVCFYFQNHLGVVLIGCVLLSLAGILDSADGQLARMTGSSSEFGRMVDGTIDNFVFMSCYFAGCAWLLFDVGWPLWQVALLGASAGLAHSAKSAVYEFYKTEYLELFNGKIESEIPWKARLLEKQGDKFYHLLIHYIIFDYTRKQLFLVTRDMDQRKALRVLTSEGDRAAFINRYRKLNKPMLTYWALLCGSNTHRTAIMVFSLFGAFEWYLYASLIWTIGTIPVSLIQAKRDEMLLRSFPENTQVL